MHFPYAGPLEVREMDNGSLEHGPLETCHNTNSNHHPYR